MSIAKHSSKAGAWTTGAAVVAAVFSSACCWLPLLLIAIGASTVGIAAFFETYRLYFLFGAGLLLGAGFYFVYFRRERCEPGSVCAVPKRRLESLNKVMLWVASGLVLVFALFPNYVGFLIGTGGGKPSSVVLSGESRLYRIEGMTCEGCAVNIRVPLSKLPGVGSAELSYAEKTVRVYFEKSATRPSDSAVLKAIREAGYRGVPAENEPSRVELHLR